MEMATPENPLQRLITDCDDDPILLQDRYEAHRSTRNAQYRAKILSPDFCGWQTDQILRMLHENPRNGEPQFVDTRNNIAIWARPPYHIRKLIADIQKEIQTVVPTLWFTPSECLHMTTLEITHSRTPSEVDTLVSHLVKSGVMSDIVSYTITHRTRLTKPIINYDTTAIALSFVPTASEGDVETCSAVDDMYTYHHLRRDLFNQVTAAGVQLNTRYTVPSSHITIARFITQEGFQLQKAGSDESYIDSGRVKMLIDTIDRINHKLKEKPVEWVVGQEKGLELHKGRSWYGGGETVLIGKGFDEV